MKFQIIKLRNRTNCFVPITWKQQYFGSFNKTLFRSGVHKISWPVSRSALNSSWNGVWGNLSNFFYPTKQPLSKIFGSAQRSLFLQLHDLYSLSCLLQCFCEVFHLQCPIQSETIRWKYMEMSSWMWWRAF